jgi:hypothetical protein
MDINFWGNLLTGLFKVIVLLLAALYVEERIKRYWKVKRRLRAKQSR